MLQELTQLLADWGSLDSWIVICGALAAMSCALPGAWLFLRRQSLLGDALSHSILPGLVLAYLLMHWLKANAWLLNDSNARHLVLFAGAAISGVISALLTEFVQRWGRLDQGAAIGVVFTSMFAFGLLLFCMFADKVDLDLGCVLYGSLEYSALVMISDTVEIPQSAVVNGCILGLNGLLILFFFKELKLVTFDSGLAESMGISSQWIQLVLMAMTAATLVAAFESVGAILVIAMLVVPAATARLLTDRLGVMLACCLVIAGLSALLGHLAAVVVPVVVFSRIGFTSVKGASSAGMMALASGVLFSLAIFLSPRHGLVRGWIDRFRLQIRIAGEDLLGSLYRHDELNSDHNSAVERPPVSTGHPLIGWFARRRLYRHQFVTAASGVIQLTDQGRDHARNLVRSHRLWEAYMARHFVLPDDHLHSTAEQVEHFLSPELQTELAAELNQPVTDPHGKSIPQ